MDCQSPLPRHMTALYLLAVTSIPLLFSPQISMVGADIIVFSEEMHRQVEVEFRDRAALFGGVLPQEGLRGSVVYSNPANACSAVAPPPSQGNPEEHWILLIRRFDCTYEEKVRSAQNANYHAAIVHNVNSTDLEPMYASHADDIMIPAVFVGEDTGITLKRKYLYDKNYFVVVNDVESFNINTHLLVPFATVVGLCFLITGGFVVVKCLQDRRRQRRHRLSSSSLRKIPTEKFRKGETPYETCAICLEDYQDGEKLRLLPCSHAYHSKCIDPWLTENRRVCPTCKRRVFAYDEREEPDSDTDSDDTDPLIRPGFRHVEHGTFTTQTQTNPHIGDLLRSDLSSSAFSESTSSSAEPNAVAAAAAVAAVPAPAGGSRGKQQRPHRHGGDAGRHRPSEEWMQTASASGLSLASSGEHSINSRPLDLDSGTGDDSQTAWGSNVALPSIKEAINNCSEDVPQVEVRTGSQNRHSKPDKKANVV